MMMPVRPSFSALALENTPILRENQFNYIRFDSLNPPFQYPLRAGGQNPLFHCSIIPIAKLCSASGNPSDGQQGDIVKLIGPANVFLKAACDAVKQLGGGGCRCL